MPLRRHRRLVLAMMLGLWAPLAVGLLVGRVGDRSLVGALILLAEPLLVVAAIYAVLVQVGRGRLAFATALAIGLAGGLASLHLPADQQPPTRPRPAWAETLRSCAATADPPHGPVRVTHQTVGEDGVLSQEAARALGATADIVVLQGTTNPAAGRLLARVMGGQYKDQRSADGGLTVVVRGSFRPCGGTDDAWSLPLPAVGDHGASGLVTLARIEGAGSFPLIALRMDGVRGPRTWGGWPARLSDASDRVATVVQAVDPDHAVVLGDFAVPPSFRSVAGLLLGAGLHEESMPPSWPSRVGPLPMLPVHRLDRLWAGRAWTTRDTHALTAIGSPRAGWTTTLVPDAMTADQTTP